MSDFLNAHFVPMGLKRPIRTFSPFSFVLQSSLHWKRDVNLEGALTYVVAGIFISGSLRLCNAYAVAPPTMGNKSLIRDK